MDKIQAYWIIHDDEFGFEDYIQCSNCREYYSSWGDSPETLRYYFCPHCGARMTNV